MPAMRHAMRLLAWLGLAACMAACGGRELSSGDGGATRVGTVGTMGGDNGGGSDASFDPCPIDPPTVGTPCNLAPHHGCRYESVSPASCAAYICDAAQHWQRTSEGC